MNSGKMKEREGGSLPFSLLIRENDARISTRVTKRNAFSLCFYRDDKSAVSLLHFTWLNFFPHRFLCNDKKSLPSVHESLRHFIKRADMVNEVNLQRHSS